MDVRAYTVPRYRLALVREGPVTTEKWPQIKNSKDVHRWLSGYFSGLDREHFVAVALDTTHAVIGLHTVSIGSLDASLAHPREVWKAMLLMNAAAVILAHNHPSGDPTPSQDDRALTARLVQCGDLLGIRVLDHVVFGEDRYFSLKDHGQM